MHDIGLGSWPRRRALASPHRVAWTHEGRDTTYAEVHARTTHLSGALGDAGVQPGDRVAYVGFNHPALLETLFATARAGAITVLVNPRLSTGELDYIVADSQPTVVVHGPELAAWAQGYAAGDRNDAGPDGSSGGVRAVVGVQEAGPGGYEAFLASGSETEATPNGLEDVCLIMYTSGTTGNPKGAMLTHGNLFFNDINQLLTVDLRPDEVCLDVGPLFHIAALNGLALPVFLKGGRQVIRTKFRPEEAFRDIREHGVTSMFTVPLMLDAMAHHPDFATADLSSLRSLICGGAPVPDRLLRVFAERGISVLQGYGLTETSPGAMLLEPEYSATKSGSAGVSQFLVDTRVVGPDGEDLPPHEPGEILIRGPIVTPGYWQKPEATEEAFTGDWFHTGDIAVRDEDGFTFLVDRSKDMYISGGENVYPTEVENRLLDVPGVAEAAVIGVADDKWGEVGSAFIVPQDGVELTEDSLRADLENRLARYKMPHHVTFVSELPRTATGKVKKHVLRQDLAGAAPGVSDSPGALSTSMTGESR
ncbi:long-chain fatty acid--CoA ligase [Citricoccus sp. NPDC055426]|uniref:acyl-CoA synthetase n=1 Tax=Citricoccus sp. NPDC055426 TaxID=3155536 RepID=UPI00342029BB